MQTVIYANDARLTRYLEYIVDGNEATLTFALDADTIDFYHEITTATSVKLAMKYQLNRDVEYNHACFEGTAATTVEQTDIDIVPTVYATITKTNDA